MPFVILLEDLNHGGHVDQTPIFVSLIGVRTHHSGWKCAAMDVIGDDDGYTLTRGVQSKHSAKHDQ